MSTEIIIRTYQTPDLYMRIPILVQECLYLYESIETDTRIPIPIPILVQEYLYLYENIVTDMRIPIPS